MATYPLYCERDTMFASQIQTKKFYTNFQYFSLVFLPVFGIFRFVSFRFACKKFRAKLTFCFAISHRSFSLPFRFVSLRSKMRGHPSLGIVLAHILQ